MFFKQYLYITQECVLITGFQSLQHISATLASNSIKPPHYQFIGFYTTVVHTNAVYCSKGYRDKDIISLSFLTAQ